MWVKVAAIVFLHMQTPLIMSFYKNNDFLTEQDKQTEENDDPANIRRIVISKEAGLMLSI